MIPIDAIARVEVLKDGASAIYGSDAIAGVINFRLRENRSGGEFTASTGERISEYDYNTGAVPAGLALDVPNKRKRTDGQTWLLPRNSAYDPIDGTHAVIQGKVISVIRAID